jgi:hypothetical protein
MTAASVGFVTKEEVVPLIRSVKVATKYHLTPISPKAKRRGDRVRNVVVERSEVVNGRQRVFVRFEGWNWWTWVYLKNDPHYVAKKGWVKNGEISREIPYVKKVY